MGQASPHADCCTLATVVLTSARQASTQAENAAQEASAGRRAAVLAALDEGLTLREIAAALGVSYQRVWQIAQSAPSGA